MKKYVLAASVVLAFAAPTTASAHGTLVTVQQAKIGIDRATRSFQGSLPVCPGYCNGINQTSRLVRVNMFTGRFISMGRPRVLNGQKRWSHWRVTGCGWVLSYDTAVRVTFVWHPGQDNYGIGSIDRSKDPSLPLAETPRLEPVDGC
jgi:hypothetical protein